MSLNPLSWFTKPTGSAEIADMVNPPKSYIPDPIEVFTNIGTRLFAGAGKIVGTTTGALLKPLIPIIIIIVVVAIFANVAARKVV